MKRNDIGQHFGSALLLGVGTLGPHYGYHTQRLVSTGNDIEDFKHISKLNGFEVKECIDSNVTRQNFQSSISKASKSLGAGDFYLLVFSGFGSCIPNFTLNSASNLTKTWCLFDSQILFPEIKKSLSLFNAGVNILIISETSFSDETDPQKSELKTNAKSLQYETTDSVYLANKDFYDAAALASSSDYPIQANAIWMHACQPNQSAHENTHNGWLTSAIKRIWRGGQFSGTLQQFVEKVTLLLPPIQSPSIEVLGGDPTELLTKKPFAI